MIRITADSLEEAYAKASKELGLSVIDLDVEIIQAPSSGFLGLFKKPAIITAEAKNGVESSVQKRNKPLSSSEDSPLNEIRKGITSLLEDSCFEIALIELSIQDDTLSIKLDGKDAALLIGKEGYRYKALSYMLHNWIKMKYQKNISLEIGSFLQNQEEMIENYLKEIEARVESQGYAHTKPLDGILVKIALQKLRARYPDKYVAIKSLKNGRKKVVVAERYGEDR